MAALEFQSGFRNNTIVILDGLKQSDMQTAARLHEELTDMGLAGNAPACTFYKIASYADLIATLNETIERCKHGLLPILHFEAHGEKDSGLELGDSGEVGRWAELHDYFQRINAITQNNLGVVMAACHGLHAMSLLRVSEPSPFYFLIGSEGKVAAGDIDDQMKRFYREMFTTKLFGDAAKLVDAKFKHFHVEEFFFKQFGRFVKREYVGKGRKARIELGVTEAANEAISLGQSPDYPALRTQFKASVRISRERFSRIALTFMHGRYSVTYEQFMKFVRQ